MSNTEDKEQRKLSKKLRSCLIAKNYLQLLIGFIFVKPGIIPEEHGDFYNRIFGFRQRADYEDFVEFDHEKVKSWLENAKKFINSVEQAIQK